MTNVLVEWPRSMQAVADEMGWNIFEVDDYPVYYSLQALDDPHGVAADAGKEFVGVDFHENQLGADDRAMAYVISMARIGNPVCRRAIEFLIDRKSPDVKRYRLADCVTWSTT